MARLASMWPLRLIRDYEITWAQVALAAAAIALLTALFVLPFSGARSSALLTLTPTPLPASPDDDDGIQPAIDGTFTDGAFAGMSDAYSDGFTDQHIGGTTFGTLGDRDGLSVTVEDAPDESDGVVISSSGGTGTATVNICAFSLLLTDGDSVVATCGSLTTSVLAGTIEVILDDNITLSASAGANVTVSESGNEIEVQNAVDSDGDVTVQLGENIVLTLSSDTTAAISETESGGFDIENSPDSSGTLTLEAEGEQTIELEPGDESVNISTQPQPTPTTLIKRKSTTQTSDYAITDETEGDEIVDLALDEVDEVIIEEDPAAPVNDAGLVTPDVEDDMPPLESELDNNIENQPRESIEDNAVGAIADSPNPEIVSDPEADESDSALQPPTQVNADANLGAEKAKPSESDEGIAIEERIREVTQPVAEDVGKPVVVDSKGQASGQADINESAGISSAPKITGEESTQGHFKWLLGATVTLVLAIGIFLFVRLRPRVNIG